MLTRPNLPDNVKVIVAEIEPVACACQWIQGGILAGDRAPVTGC